MELFTSQGCSSCPSADRLLGKYANDPSVIALSFHVDYWNHLGWKDPFSTAENSARQQMYASSLNTEGIYTPQLVINGEREMVGSDEKKIKSTLTDLINESSNTGISITKLSSAEGKFEIKFTLQNLPRDASVHLAVVQKKEITAIRAGENRGVTLTNYNIVRSFQDVKAKDGGNETTVTQPTGLDNKEVSIVLIVQDKSNRIIAAIQQQVPGSKI